MNIVQITFFKLLFPIMPLRKRMSLLESQRRLFYISSVSFKKRKTKEERKTPVVYELPMKSKWKTIKVTDIWRNMTVNELSKQLNKDVNHVFEAMEFINNTDKYRKGSDVIDDLKVIEEVVKKTGLRYKIGKRPSDIPEEEEKEDISRRDKLSYKDLRQRPPIITVMGHVDHGKTTLLDTLRHTSVVDQEFGGITQHIGAFSVLINEKDQVTFLDTPGHAAFFAMRNRGAHCTDIVILVVAADDGVMEQTIESIRMAEEAKVPMVVAINKIDKSNSDIEESKRSLLQAGLQVEDSGGDIQVVPISALKGTNVDTLMEAVLTQAELMELKTDYQGLVEGVVIESWTDPQRGKLCTLLVQVGTLRKGAVIVAGKGWAKIRAMFNDKGVPVNEALPSTPVQTIGWRELPSAGDEALEVLSERRANEVISLRKKEKMEQKIEEDLVSIKAKEDEHYKTYRELLEKKRKMGRYKSKPQGPRRKEYQETSLGPRLNLIVKGDVDGSVEAILDVLHTYSDPKCQLDVIHYGVGPVTPNDVILANSFSAIIYTFNTTSLKDAAVEAKSKQIKIKNFNVIYKLVEQIKADIDGTLPMVDSPEVIGEANVLQEFLVNERNEKVPVAGSRCTKGVLKKSAHFKVVRNNETIYDGKALSLRHLKDEVGSIKKDLECGLKLEDASLRFQQGDTIVCYIVNKVPQSVKWDPGF